MQRVKIFYGFTQDNTFDDLEQEINGWLEDHQNITIVERNSTPLNVGLNAMDQHTTFVTVFIYYEEG